MSNLLGVRKSSLEVSAIGFGCMGLNFGYATSLSKDRKKHFTYDHIRVRASAVSASRHNKVCLPVTRFEVPINSRSTGRSAVAPMR